MNKTITTLKISNYIMLIICAIEICEQGYLQIIADITNRQNVESTVLVSIILLLITAILIGHNNKLQLKTNVYFVTLIIYALLMTFFSSLILVSLFLITMSLYCIYQNQTNKKGKYE